MAAVSAGMNDGLRMRGAVITADDVRGLSAGSRTVLEPVIASFAETARPIPCGCADDGDGHAKTSANNAQLK